MWLVAGILSIAFALGAFAELLSFLVAAPSWLDVATFLGLFTCGELSSALFRTWSARAGRRTR